MVNTSAPRITDPTKWRRTIKWIAGIASGLSILVWIGLGVVMLHTPERDYSTTRLSDGGLFMMTIVPDNDPIPINKIHTWTLHVETPSGDVIENGLSGCFFSLKNALPSFED